MIRTFLNRFLVIISILISLYTSAIQADVKLNNFEAIGPYINGEKKEKIKGHFEKAIEEIIYIQQYGYDNYKKLSALDEKLTQMINRFEKAVELEPFNRKIKTTKFVDSITFSAYGYKVQLPWKEYDETYRTEPVTVIKFNNWLVAIENPMESFGRINYDYWKDEYFESIFFNEPPDNLYKLVETVLKATSKRLNDGQDLVQIVTKKSQLYCLLSIKSQYTNDNEGQGIYADSLFSFALPNIKGFQIGTPYISKRTALVLFPNDNTELTIKIYQSNKGNITQEHIDYIIRNFNLILQK